MALPYNATGFGIARNFGRMQRSAIMARRTAHNMRRAPSSWHMLGPTCACPNLVRPGFDGEVRQANQSELGRRNGGSMLSMQVGGGIRVYYAHFRVGDFSLHINNATLWMQNESWALFGISLIKSLGYSALHKPHPSPPPPPTATSAPLESPAPHRNAP